MPDLADDGDVNFSFPRDLAADLGQVRVREYARNFELARILDRDLARASARVRALTNSSEFDRERDAARASALDRALYSVDRIRDGIRPRVVVTYRYREDGFYGYYDALRFTFNRAVGRAHADSDARARNRARCRVTDLADALEDARSFVQAMNASHGAAAVTSGRERSDRWSSAALRLLAVAVWRCPPLVEPGIGRSSGRSWRRSPGRQATASRS
jgi:hypothetical protein